MRLLVASTRGQGHVRPLLPFVHAARAAGHDVLLAGPPALEPVASAERIGFQPVGTADARRLEHVGRMLEGRPMMERITLATTELFVGSHARAALPGMLELVAAWRPDLVLRETAEGASQLAAEAHGVPVARAGIGLCSPAEDWWLSIASPALDELRGRLGLPADPDAERVLATPVLTQASPLLDAHQGDPPADVRRFRAAAGEPAPPPDAWSGAAADAPLVLVTFGTEVPRNGHFPGLYRTVVDALAGRGLRVLVTTGRDADPAALGPLPAGVRARRWVPQAAVMPHSAAILHHGGAGTTLAGLAAGLPMVVLPMSADQPLNARRVAELGAGIALEGGTADAARAGEALEAVLSGPTHREAAERVAADIALLPTFDEAPDALESIAAGAFRPA